MKIRPSSRPLAILCPTSVLPAEHPIRDEGLPLRRGSAVHRLLHMYLVDEDTSLQVVQEVASRYRVDWKDLDELFEKGKQAIDTLGEHLPDSKRLCEYELPEWNGVKGTVDLLCMDDDLIVVVDWKSGRSDGDHYEQLIDYAWRVRALEGNEERAIKAIAVNLELSTWTVYEFDEAAFRGFLDRDSSIRERAGKEYNPGAHCGYCPRRLDCGAYSDLQRSSIYALTEVPSFDAVSVEKLAESYPKVQMLSKLLDSYKEALRANLMHSDGPLPVGGGKEVLLKEYKKEEIDPKRAWAVLQKSEFSDDDIASVLRISKTAVQDIVGAKYEVALSQGNAKPRMKTRMKEEIMHELRKAGAVTQTSSLRLQQRKVRS